MSPVVSLDVLKEMVAGERAAGRTVALANGCFDLLHVGHVRYLLGAAAEADVLVVAVNDDASVRHLKGEGRPILTAADRAELVAGIRGVDYVVTFGGRTVAEVIDAIRPDVHCKGTDYTAATVPERAQVLAYGGRVAIVGDPKDHSTRDLVRRLGAPEARPAGASAKAGAEGDNPGPAPRDDSGRAEHPSKGASDADRGSGGAKPSGRS